MARPPQSTQDDPNPSIVLQKWEGLKNTVSVERLGPSDLQRAINIDLDDQGEPRRRRGYTQVGSGDFHSLFNADDGTVVGVKDGQIGIVMPDFSFYTLRRVVGGDPTIGAQSVSYAQIGPTIYYSCASDSGKIDLPSKSAWDWSRVNPDGTTGDYWLSPVVNPTATLAPIRGRLIGAPPLATSIIPWRGRIYLAQGNLVWATELFLYDYVDKTRNFFAYEGDVTMLGVVGDGYYVGTTEGLWFCEGEFPQKRIRVMDSGVLPGSMVSIPSELANPPQTGLAADTPLKVSIAFMTTTGFCVADDGGEAYNLTEAKFDFPVAQRSAAFYRRQDGINQYIAVNDSEGDPANNARIGDYVEADIVRFRGAWIDVNEGVTITDQFTVD